MTDTRGRIATVRGATAIPAAGGHHAHRSAAPIITATAPLTPHGKPGCTGKDEDDDPGGKPPKHPNQPKKPGCG